MAGSKLVIGLVAGALIGAAAGLLIAPKASAESRRVIDPRGWAVPDRHPQPDQ